LLRNVNCLIANKIRKLRFHQTHNLLYIWTPQIQLRIVKLHRQNKGIRQILFSMIFYHLNIAFKLYNRLFPGRLIMKQALIIFQSRNGRTKKYAEKIGCYFNSLNIEATVIPIENFRKDLLISADYVLLGCWTNGTFLLNQKPQKTWINFVKSMQLDKNKKVALFTTYTILTGSMFKNMKKHLYHEPGSLVMELKSKDGKLSEIDKQRLLEFLN